MSNTVRGNGDGVIEKAKHRTELTTKEQVHPREPRNAEYLSALLVNGTPPSNAEAVEESRANGGERAL